MVWLPINPGNEIDLSSAEKIEEFFKAKIADPSTSTQEEVFTTFVRSIQTEPLEAEQEWLVHKDERLHYSIEFPAGLGYPYSTFYGSGSSIGPDHKYSISFRIYGNSVQR